MVLMAVPQTLITMVSGEALVAALPEWRLSTFPFILWENWKIPFNEFSFCLNYPETVSDACNQKNITNTGSGLGLALQINRPYLHHKEIDSSSLEHSNKYIFLNIYTSPLVTPRCLSASWFSPPLPDFIQLPIWYLHLNVLLDFWGIRHLKLTVFKIQNWISQTWCFCSKWHIFSCSCSSKNLGIVPFFFSLLTFYLLASSVGSALKI